MRPSDPTENTTVGAPDSDNRGQDTPDLGVRHSPRYPSISLRQALELPTFRAALPVVVAGAESLDRTIRWVHAGDLPDIATYLRGGELILTTGMAIGARPAQQREFVHSLADKGVAGLAIELGSHFTESLPGPLVQTAEDVGMPLVELHASTAFVDITEAVHTEISSHQYDLLQRAEALQQEFTSAMLEGGGVPAVLSVLARAVANPVFFDDGMGRLLGYGSPTGNSSNDGVLRAWTKARSNADVVGLTAPVPSHGVGGSGRIVLLPIDSPMTDFAPLALNRAAQIVALALLRSRQEEELLALNRGDLLGGLVAQRIDATFAAARAQEMGFGDRHVAALLPVAARLTNRLDDGSRTATDTAPIDMNRWVGTLRDLEAKTSKLNVPIMVGVESRNGDLLMVLGLRKIGDREMLADLTASILQEVAARRASSDVVIAVGSASDWATLGDNLREATEATAVAASRAPRPWHDAASMPLDRLLWKLGDNDDVRRFSDKMLGAVVAHDAASRNPLLPTLASLCENGGRKAETARALYLNRQALYDRITRLEKVLGADLSDWDTILALHLAIRSRSSARPAATR